MSINRNKFIRLLRICSMVVALSIVAMVLCGCSRDDSPVSGEDPDGQQQVEEEPGFEDPLTGSRVERVSPLVAVMVDNLGPARPQTGLAEAGVVYEMETEAKITRFMALFAGDPPAEVGPVRSARTYFLQTCKEWDALYAHVGGAKAVLAEIRNLSIKDLDEFRNNGEFYRDQSRRAPHNAYLKLDKAVEGRQDVPQAHWRFGQPREGDPDFEKVSFSYGSGYSVSYRFSGDEKGYLRYINSEPHSDRESGKQILVTNVVLQYAPHHYRGDGTPCIDIQLVGNGRAEFFLAGEYREGSWQKESIQSPTRFFDEEGIEITFPKGNTWIQMLRPGTAVEKISSQ